MNMMTLREPSEAAGDSTEDQTGTVRPKVSTRRKLHKSPKKSPNLDRQSWRKLVAKCDAAQAVSGNLRPGDPREKKAQRRTDHAYGELDAFHRAVWAGQPEQDIGLLAEVCYREFWPGLDLTAPDSDAIMAKGPHCSDDEQPDKALAALLGAIRDRFVLQPDRAAYLPPNVKAWRQAHRHYLEALAQAGDDTAASRACDSLCELSEQAYTRPAKTLADILLIAEAAIEIAEGDLGKIFPDDYLNEGHDVERVQAHLVKAVLDLIGGQTEAERRARQIELQKINNDPDAVDEGAAKAAARAR